MYDLADPAMFPPIRGAHRISMFPYENWKVYKLALELRDVSTELSSAGVRGSGSDFDHLRRAASSIVYNLAEGAMRRSKGKKVEHYHVALGSVGEANAALTVLRRVHPNGPLILHGVQLCHHIAPLLTNLIKSVENRFE